MKLTIKIAIVFLIIFLSQCTKPSLNTDKCNAFNKTSKEYIDCMSDEINSTNTVKNFKEFKKHKTLKSFFKQVEVIESD
tara:strand:+ start:331 stop:567 length:237 start_codon:yes stop_codon:yes gene_type:complete